MGIKLGEAKPQDKLTLRDLQAAPIWMSPWGDGGRTLRPVLARDPDVTAQICRACTSPWILCTVREQPQLFARGWYSRTERHLSMLAFWQGGRWIGLKEFKAPRPLTLVAAPKIEGKAGVEFYLLTKHDLDAPRIGGTLCRVTGPDKFKHMKLARGMVPQRVREKPPSRTPAATSAPRAEGPVKLVGAKLGPLTSPGKITLKDRTQHPVWVSTYEEDKAGEDAQRAVISRDPNVSGDLLRQFLSATVTFKVEGMAALGIGEYEREVDALTSVRFWSGKRWDTKLPKGVSAPLTLEPLCRILGKRGVRFTLKRATDRSAPRLVP